LAGEMRVLFSRSDQRSCKGRAKLHMHCIYKNGGVFDWDGNNLRKIRAHHIRAEEVEEALSNDPIPIYQQAAENEIRFVY
jgi:hypothetical protein